MVPLVSQREQATGRIASSSEALAALEPVLHLLENRVEKLEKHIKEDMTPECKESKEVSKVLKQVRDLILSLEKCPGRNNFHLLIPKEHDEHENEEKNGNEDNKYKENNEIPTIETAMLASQPPKDSKH